MNQLFTLLSRYNRREQTLLLGIGVVVIIYLLWMVVLAPIQSNRDELAKGNITANQTLGRVQIMVAQIQQARGQGAAQGSSENINGLIDSTLRANGLSMSGFQPGTAGEVRVRLDRAAYQPLLQWLYDVEFKHGISVRDLSIASTNDPGQVTVNLRLQKSN